MITRDLEAWTTDAVARHAAAGLAATVPAGGRLLLGVSGGSDSVGLLAALLPSAGRRLVLGHVDHGVRVGSSDDRAFVESLAGGLGLPLAAVRLGPAPPPTETRLRALRLDALERMARTHDCRAILLAHHLDDALETSLLHLLRGHRGARALAGPPTLRPAGAGLVLCRPLLHGPRPPGRRALLRMRRAAGLGCVQDPTNRDLTIPRNRVRALLAETRAPLDRERLTRLRRTARLALQSALSLAAHRLATGLSASGRGSALDAALVSALRGADGTAVECLRLLGRCLASPVALEPRRSVLERLARTGRGRALLPGSPRAVELTLAGDRGWLADEPPAPGAPTARLLAALVDTPLHL